MNEIQFLAKLIQIGIDRGVFQARDPQIAAQIVLGAVAGVTILSLLQGYPTRERMEQLEVETINAGLHYLMHQDIIDEIH